MPRKKNKPGHTPKHLLKKPSDRPLLCGHCREPHMSLGTLMVHQATALREAIKAGAVKPGSNRPWPLTAPVLPV